jgi:hypothetical protein
MNSMPFSLLANSNPEVNENKEMELTFGSLSFYIGPSGSTRLSDPMKSVPSAGKAERTIASGSSVGSSSEANSPVSLAATEILQGKLEEPNEIRKETRKRRWWRLDDGDLRRRFDDGLRQRGTADGGQRATVIMVVVFGSSPASRFGGNRRMEVATVCRLW